jgi:hypothetical protein
MVRQHHKGVDSKRAVSTRSFHGIAQRIDAIDQQ